MFKSFSLWLEEREEGADRHVQGMLMKRLGFDPKAADPSTLKLRDFSKDRIQQALGQMGMDQGMVHKLQNWVLDNPDTTLQNLLDQIGQSDLSDDGDPDVPSQPAFLPDGQPKQTPWSQRQPAPAMYGGGPSSGGGAAGLT